MNHRFLRSSLFIVALFIVAAFSASFIQPTPASAKPASQAGMTLIWSDEFSGAANTGVNTGNWLYDTGTCYPGCPAANWGTGEVETMTTSTANVYQDGAGHLVIKPILSGGTWTSGRIETQRTDFAPPAGGILRVEASLQQPNVSGAAAAGYWPAFWMLGAPFRGVYTNWPSIGEIDIMEDINGLSSEFATLHCGTSPGGPCNETTGIGSGQRACSGCQTGYHIYAMEYDKSVSPQQIRFYLDGSNFFTINSNQVDATTWNNATNHGFFIILNVAIGGGFPAAFGGGPTGSTVSGIPMLVDYVRVYTKSATTATATPPPSGNGNPYSGTPAPIPGTIQAENFNTGGEGVAYHDSDTTNSGGQYRTSEGVDIEATTDTGAGYNVGWTAAGEWMKYTVNVASSGTYNLNFRVASAQAGGTFHLEVDGANVSGTMTVPNTGGWQVWTTLTKTGVSLSAGQHILRWVTDAAGGNYNWMSFASSGTGPTPTFAPPTNTPPPSTGNTLYVLSGGVLSTTAGTSGSSVTIASAGGVNHDGVVTNPQTFTITGLTRTYNAGNSTFDLFVDSGAGVGNGVQVKVSYDFTGDGTWDRTETYHYFSTNNVAGWEDYNQTSFGGLESSTGAYSNLSNGKVMIQVWSAIGTATSTLSVNATSSSGAQSKIVIPFR